MQAWSEYLMIFFVRDIIIFIFKSISMLLDLKKRKIAQSVLLKLPDGEQYQMIQLTVR